MNPPQPPPLPRLKKSIAPWKIILGIILGIIVGLPLLGFVIEQIEKADNSQPMVKAEVALTASALLIRNTDNFTWPEVTIYINDGDSCSYGHPVAPNETIRVPLTAFAYNDRRFNPAERIVVRAEVVVAGRKGAGISFR
jgi:hypothetical protein